MPGDPKTGRSGAFVDFEASSCHAPMNLVDEAVSRWDGHPRRLGARPRLECGSRKKRSSRADAPVRHVMGCHGVMRAVHVVVVGRGVVAGDGRVVDVGGAEGGDAAADADAEQVGRPGLAGGGGSVDAEGGTSAGPAVAPPPAPACPPDAGQGLVGRDDVGGLGLLGPLLRPQPRA